MNKVLIVVLAVCLVSTSAFVKRDAPKKEVTLESIQKDLTDLSKNIGGKVSEALDPEQIKKNFGDAVDKLNELINQGKEKLEELQKSKS